MIDKNETILRNFGFDPGDYAWLLGLSAWLLMSTYFLVTSRFIPGVLCVFGLVLLGAKFIKAKFESCPKSITIKEDGLNLDFYIVSDRMVVWKQIKEIRITELKQRSIWRYLLVYEPPRVIAGIEYQNNVLSTFFIKKEVAKAIERRRPNPSRISSAEESVS